MILSVNDVRKTYVDRDVLKDVSFHVNENDKCALVGINGCGKTTLLNIIVSNTILKTAGHDPSLDVYDTSQDNGVISLSKDATVGYLPQNAVIEGNNTIYEEVKNVKRSLFDMQLKLRELEDKMNSLSDHEEIIRVTEDYHRLSEEFDRLGGYMAGSEISGALKGLGFTEDDFDTPVSVLSGGQKTRVALAKLLVGAPDLIILDEPTNHLDISSISWLENYLKTYKGTVLIVSHDRYFLDRIVGKVFELQNGHLNTYNGNYTEYAVKKEALRVASLNAYLNQQRDINHQKEVIEKLRSFNREKSIKRAESRQKMLDKMEVLDKPEELNDRMQIVLTPWIESGKDVIDVEGLSKRYDDLLFDGIEFHIKRGEHVALIGDNGTGKTTILKMINGLVSPDAGDIRLGSNVEIGYYDQEHHVLDDSKTMYDEISDAYPYLKETEIRNTLAAFLFTGDDVYKLIGSLSGGEKGRVSLAKLMLSNANFLILDEPTNHLDMTSKEILENALNNYTGTLLYVSHDRYFINKTAERILDLRRCKLTEYLGDYDYYVEKSAELGMNVASGRSDVNSKAGLLNGLKNDNSLKNSDSAISAAETYKAQKAAAAEEKRKQKRIDELEDKISKLEEELSDTESMLNDPKNGTNKELLIKLSKQKDNLDEKLIEAMQEWERLSM